MVHFTSSILTGTTAATRRRPPSRRRSPISKLQAAYRRGGTAEVGQPDWAQELVVLRRLVDELGYRPESMDGGEVDLEAISRTTVVLFLPPAT
jgi:hypothetical protein